MRFDKELIDKLNDRIKNKTKNDLRIGDGFDVSIVKGNWCILDLQELSTFISDLTRIRDIVEEETKIRF